MIKLMVAALWISIATTGALLFSFHWAQAPHDTSEQAELPSFKGLDFVRTGIISVPVFEKGRVHGYFLTRLVFTAKAARLAQLKLPAEALLADQVYTHLYANPQIDFTHRDDLDVDAFRAGIRDGVNQRIGEELIHEVLIEQVDYLPKDQVGSSSIRNAAAAQEPSL